MKVVVLGGYGNFGARICAGLKGNPQIDLVVAGRDPARADAVVDVRAPGLANALRRLGAGLVIHTAGPFQGQDYRVAAACAEAGAHYIDLADGRRFVCDFPREMDRAFQQAGRTAITGASTVPSLSSAVVDAARRRVGEILAIDICIAPAQRAPRGVATMAGVLSYCGGPVQVWRQGQWQSLHGWSDPVPVTFARLRPRLGALCDIPDLELFPARYPRVRHVMFRAALEVRVTQAAFGVLASLRRRGWISKPERLASSLHRMGKLVDWLGTPDGGMVVRVTGEQGTATWDITAPNHHGPEIPCMAAILLARKLAQGAALPRGAMACMGLLALEEFAPEFAKWGMTAEWAGDSTAGGSP